MTLRTIVVDDEPLALELVCNLLTRYADIEIIATARNGREALQLARQFKPDLLFLDIQMPGYSGLDVAARLQSDTMPLIVFITAFDEFALNAFDVNAIDYVLKPIDPERLTIAVERARERSFMQAQDLRKAPLIGAITDINHADNQEFVRHQKLAIRDGSDIHFIPFDDIDWVDAAGDYMCVHTAGNTHIMRITMKQLTERLCSPNFARVHRSTIVNLDKVESIHMLSKGECELNLQGDVSIKVSRNFRQNVSSLLP